MTMAGEASLVDGPRASVDVYLIGLGMQTTRQLTHEAQEALDRSAQVFMLHSDPLVQRKLRARHPRLHDLGSLYVEGRSRLETYEAVAATVLEAATVSPPVSLAVYGHPLMFVRPTRIIIDSAAGRGLRVRTLPGISALDILLVDLHLDPATDGLLMYEATDVLLRERQLLPYTPCLLWQIGTIGTTVYRGAHLEVREGLTRLAAYLTRFYSPNHDLTVARSATLPVARARLLATTIEGLPELADVVDGADTLYLPPTGRSPIRDTALYDALREEVGYDYIGREG